MTAPTTSSTPASARGAWRELGVPRATSETFDLVDVLRDQLAKHGSSKMVLDVIQPTIDFQRVVMHQLSRGEWIAVVIPREGNAILLHSASDDEWVRDLRELVRRARAPANLGEMEVVLDEIERFEADVLQDARYHAARAVALVALLLQDSEDADGELEALHGALVGAGDVIVRALDKALQKRGRVPT